jgi:hypothetical protein
MTTQRVSTFNKVTAELADLTDRPQREVELVLAAGLAVGAVALAFRVIKVLDSLGIGILH